MLWALGQPAAAVGLAVGFLLGLGLRVLAQRLTAVGQRVWPYRVVTPHPRLDVDPIGAVAAVLGGTGWGCGVRPEGMRLRTGAVVLAGPLAVLAGSQTLLLGYAASYPAQRAVLALNHPSDVLRGVVAPTMAAQLVLSAAVGMLSFALLALLPLPPLDGFRLVRLIFTDGTAAPSVLVDRLGGLGLLLGVAIPVAGGLPLVVLALDVVGTPLLRAWT